MIVFRFPPLIVVVLIPPGEKRSQILYHVHKTQTKILLLQETHHRTDGIQAMPTHYFHSWYLSTNPRAKSKGVSIAFHKSFHPKILDALIDPTGRLIFLKLKHQSSIFTVANVYGPNQEQGSFLTAVLDRLLSFGGPCFILGGDLNVALSPSVDTSSGMSSVAHSTLMHMKSLLHSANLVDVWRLDQPTERDYSYYSVAHKLYSRLDYLCPNHY